MGRRSGSPLWYIITATVVMFALLEALMLSVFYAHTERAIERRGQRSQYAISRVSEAFLVDNIHSIVVMSSAVDEMLRAGHSIDQIQRFLVNTSREVASRADVRLNDMYGIVDGQFVSVMGYGMADDADMTAEPWYVEATSGDRAVAVTRPTIDPATGEIAVSISTRLASGRGVLAIDVPLDRLKELTNEFRGETTRMFFIIDGDGTVVCHTDSSMIGRSLRDMPEGSEARIIYDSVTSSPEGQFWATLSGRRCEVFKQNIYGGGMGVIVLDPMQELGRSIVPIAIATFAIVMCAAALLAFAVFNDRRRAHAAMLSRQLAAAAGVYHSMYMVDLEHDTFKELSSFNELRSIVGYESAGAKEIILRAMTLSVDEASLEKMLEFCDLDTLNERLADRKSVSVEFLGKLSGWCRARFIPIERDADGKLKSVLYGIEIIDEAKRRENQLRYLAEMDALTGLNNEATGERLVKDLMSIGKSGMFCLFDIRAFHSLCEQLGYNTGDVVIAAVANALKSSLRERDIMLRVGRDVFAAYAVGITTPDAAALTIERAVKAIDELVIPELAGRTIDLCVGAAFHTAGDGMTYGDIYARADNALSTSKKHGGSKFTLA